MTQGKRRVNPKGKKVVRKPLPIEVNQDEYVEILNNTKFMHHK
ncbi:hypothetical protein LCGC14_1506360, partial [marine sediment metagenome]